jgi:V4R domain
MAEQLERFHPILMHSLLTATRRFEPGLYDSICRRFNLDAERILGLFKDVEEVGAGQLPEILSTLRNHQAYHEIVFLAGRNSLLGWAEANRVALNHRGGEERFSALARQFLPDFLGRGTFTLMSRGKMIYVEVHDSVFARGVESLHPVCGFYEGFLSELGSGCSKHNVKVAEVRCFSMDAPHSCMFQVPF